VAELDFGDSLDSRALPLAAAPTSSFTRAASLIRDARRSWVHILLFICTFITTTAFGFALSASFRARSGFDVRWVTQAYLRLLHGDPAFFSGLEFSIPLLVILVAHEAGHYVTCKLRNVKASLPFFLPSPALLGTFGAFILVRSPFYRRKALFDIGVSGPIAGFVALLPFLAAGIEASQIVPGIGLHAPFVFGTPVLMRLAEKLVFPAVPAGSISLHPMAIAAWAGLLATALNLLPIGQLDGGHILYAMFGERWHRTASTLTAVALFFLGFFYWPWWFWAFLMFLFGRRHRLVCDDERLSRARIAMGWVALAILVLSFSIVPVRTN
jgi:membrane-associated protease RseP (regulator of RpoE activity)